MAKIEVQLLGAAGERTVGIEPVSEIPLPAGSQDRAWERVAATIATDISKSDVSQPEKSPTADDLFQAHLPQHIEASRWGRYILPGPASYVFDGRIFVYSDPCHGFWDLYNLSKGIFKNLGIKLSKINGVWEANIPIRVLTDKVFVESGLAGVEKTLLQHTGIDPGEILDSIRQRQCQETKNGMKKVKQMRETIADAVGVLAIMALSWASYVVFGGAL